MTSAMKTLLSSGQDEAVSVNQRALVEKILARYSGENTLFRELLQNADDASATTVEIHFRTSTDDESATTLYPAEALPDLKTHKIGSYLVKNDGIVFREEDWNRLKRVAEGNPDESKIGTFGVGFYSLFNICDEPLVVSGEKLMGFFWKHGGDQLYVKTAANTKHKDAGSATIDGKPWTSFFMELRENAPMPDPSDLARFLATCLGFTACIRTISMHFDGHLLCRIGKTFALSRPLPLHQNLGTVSSLKLLTIESIAEVPLQLHAEVSRWLVHADANSPRSIPPLHASSTSPTASASEPKPQVSSRGPRSKLLLAFSRTRTSPQEHSTPAVVVSASAPPPYASPLTPTDKSDPLSTLKSTLFLRVVSATLAVTPTPEFSREMVRATKKNLPKSTQFSLIWTGKDEYDASYNVGGSVAAGKLVFAGLLSNLDTNGKVFIGFPTFQTTGCAASVAARFVSTVERESVDFQARYVADWNKELLWAGGIVARTVYEEEMAEISKIFKTTPSWDSDAKLRLHARAVHLMRFFHYTESTPSSVVGAETEASFFAVRDITLPTQRGPLPASSVRLPNPAISFCKRIAIIPPIVGEIAPYLLASYRARLLVGDISLDDVFTDLQTSALTIQESVEMFKWWIMWAQNKSYNSSYLAKLRDAAMISIPSSDEKSEAIVVRSLGGFKTIFNPKTISPDLPLPPDTLPFELSRSFQLVELELVFEFSELKLVDWAKFITSAALVGEGAPATTNILVSSEFAEKVLHTVARGWASLSQARQTVVVGSLSDRAFIPTLLGQRVPKEVYFSKVKLFDDLPIVTLPSGIAVKAPLENLLTALGVRKTVNLELVLNRLLEAGDWSHVDVIRYLVFVKSTLKDDDTHRLRRTPWLPKEGETGSNKKGVSNTPKRWTAAELFEPTEALRALGLPLLDWPELHKWRSNSEEAKLLFTLRLRRSPSVQQVLKTASDPKDPIRQEVALRYFLSEFEHANYASSYSPVKHDYPFVPSTINGTTIEQYRRPQEVFTNPAVELLGFPILAIRLKADSSRLRIAQDPSGSMLAAAVIGTPPADIEKASAIFSYLSSQANKFTKADIKSLGKANIIPLPSPNKQLKLVSSSECFFFADSTLPTGLRKFFPIIPNFGSVAKSFLVQIGVKESPSPQHIAAMIVEEPEKFFGLSGPSSYLSLLRLAAISCHSFPPPLTTKIRSSSFFLGTYPENTSTIAGAKREDGTSNLVFKLAKGSDLVVNDDPSLFRLFQDVLLGCPQERQLENWALDLGATRLSGAITATNRVQGKIELLTPRATEVQTTILERIFLFLDGRDDIKHDAEWLQDNLEVLEVGSIQLLSSLHIPSGKHKKEQSTSACIQVQLKTGKLQLHLARDVELDFFDIAHSLCRSVLYGPRLQDSLLLLTILTTSLQSLKRRGFNVDRIFSTRQLELDPSNLRLHEHLATQEETKLQEHSLTGITTNPSVSQDTRCGFFSQMKRRFGSSSTRNTPRTSPITPGQIKRQASEDSLDVAGARALFDHQAVLSSPAAISANVIKAIQASKLDLKLDPKHSSRRRKATEMASVKESDQISCDPSGSKASTLVFVTNVARYRILVSSDVVDGHAYAQSNDAALVRFISQIVTPVSGVFSLDSEMIHIFYDLSGLILAFNHNGEIYLNFRYYLAWHDAQVAKGLLRDALISTFLLFAHEIAHNISKIHDAQFAFYSSRITEMYFPKMAELLKEYPEVPQKILS